MPSKKPVVNTNQVALDKEAKDAKLLKEKRENDKRTNYWNLISTQRYKKEEFYTKMMINFAVGGIIALLTFVGFNDEIVNLAPMQISVGLLSLAIIQILIGVYSSIESHDAVLYEMNQRKEARSNIHQNTWSLVAGFLYITSTAFVIIGVGTGLWFVFSNIS